MVPVMSKPSNAGIRSLGRVLGWAVFAAALAMAGLDAAGRVDAQEPKLPEITANPTLVIFADRKMADGEWAALFDALGRNVPEASAEAPAIAVHPQIMRGDAVVPGMSVASAIVVYLHGDCTLAPLVRRSAYGVPLGWVRAEHGRIEPFVHVNCSAIGQVLGADAAGLDRTRRDAMMGGAVARVILHEWIHIATQNMGHSMRGLSKAEFGVDDLIAGQGQLGAQLRGSR
jgi:hypothetical protein